MRRIYLLSLGCAKNLVDSEHMLGALVSRGHKIANSIEESDVVLINTCGFLEASSEEAVDAILEAVELKKKGDIETVLVAGCLVQRYGYKLRREIPEVDGWLGTGETHRVADLLGRRERGPAPFYLALPRSLPDHRSPRIRTTPFFSGYMRIAEGCSHGCSYCMIPKLRGRLRSRRPESLLLEAEEMAANGVKEINLIAQDTTVYGSDLSEPTSLEDLLERLVAVRGIEWIRLLYCHPERVSGRLLELMDAEAAICPYLDLPFQHVSGPILKAMGRGGGPDPRRLIERIRGRRRRFGIRSTFMVGFPGETEAMFEELLDFVSDAELDHVGVFVFSPEKGTKAERLRPAVDKKEARRRLETLMALQADVSKRINERLIGRTLPVLIEGPHPETELLLSGRTATMAPDVDGRVIVNEGEGKEGEILPVLIKEAHPYDLVGEIVSSVP